MDYVIPAAFGLPPGSCKLPSWSLIAVNRSIWQFRHTQKALESSSVRRNIVISWGKLRQCGARLHDSRSFHKGKVLASYLRICSSLMPRVFELWSRLWIRRSSEATSVEIRPCVRNQKLRREKRECFALRLPSPGTKRSFLRRRLLGQESEISAEAWMSEH